MIKHCYPDVEAQVKAAQERRHSDDDTRSFRERWREPDPDIPSKRPDNRPERD